MRTAIFITVRLGSKRLHQKAMLDICGKPAICWLINRAKRCKVDEIVLCTTTLSEDEPLREMAHGLGIKVFNGSEKNVIMRHLEAARYFKIDFIVNMDGDDLFAEPYYINKILEFSKDHDVVYTKGLPIGCNIFGYLTSCLERVLPFARETGWGELLRNDQMFVTKVIEAQPQHLIDAHLTLDYLKDWEFFRRVMGEMFFVFGKHVSLTEIVAFLRKHPEIVDINKQDKEKHLEYYERGKKEK